MESKRFQELVLPQWQGVFKMTILENVLEDNKKFVESFEGEEMSHHAQKKLAILTCMDCRLIDFFEPALGLERGDAKIVRNAGNSIVGEDAIRSIAAALYNLGAEEVMVVGHTECGMAGADAEALKEKMIARGIKEEDIAKYDLSDKINMDFVDEYISQMLRLNGIYGRSSEEIAATATAIKDIIADLYPGKLLSDADIEDLRTILPDI